jgi:hypothetical protein
MSSTAPTATAATEPARFRELRRFQVYRLERLRQRPLLQRLRRGIRSRLHR